MAAFTGTTRDTAQQSNCAPHQPSARGDVSTALGDIQGAQRAMPSCALHVSKSLTIHNKTQLIG